ncbi:hypothetical protein [Spiroplasma poulsonii]|uniref:hypothetical protein n=1 Tax=Spiroplasma poulsonii TaxID=2138 RepID=UPI001F4C6071|nr:hypothetical protein [Spiroplasma poulsonii]UNF61679.1 hypothetical protein MNU24_07145 [Spiroplasma poulsonii]
MQQVFNRKKHEVMLYLKNQNPNFKNPKLIVDSGYQGIQKNHNNVHNTYKKTRKTL